MIFLRIENLKEKLRKREAGSIESMSKFAVLLPLIKVDNQWELIFELRSMDLKSQPGEISFPGGRLEKNEDYIDAAIRETIEELKIRKENIEILGELDYLISYSNMRIHCFLSLIKGVNVKNISPNQDEVDHIFTVPLDYFLENQPREYYLEMETKYNAEFPYNLIPNGQDYSFRKPRRKIYFYEYNDYTIWGYTASMVKHLVEVIKDQ